MTTTIVLFLKWFIIHILPLFYVDAIIYPCPNLDAIIEKGPWLNDFDLLLKLMFL